VSILDDACRIGRFAVMDARYGHFRDRFHPAIDLDARAPDVDLWCVFSPRVANPSWSSSRETAVKVVDVVPVAPRSRSSGDEDALFLRAPFWIPVGDVVQESSFRQQTPLPHEVSLAIVRAVVDALIDRLPAPSRAPWVALETVGVGVDGRVHFFGWRPGAGEAAGDGEELRRAWNGVADVAARVFEMGPQRSFIVETIRGHDVMTSSNPPPWDRDRFVDLHRRLDGIGGIEEASHAWIAELVANLFPARIAERRELEEELAACSPAELRALPPPKA
jgi:hypothetical protein